MREFCKWFKRAMDSFEAIAQAVDEGADNALKAESAIASSAEGQALAKVAAKTAKAGFEVMARELATIAKKVENLPTLHDMEAMLKGHAKTFATGGTPSQPSMAPAWRSSSAGTGTRCCHETWTVGSSWISTLCSSGPCLGG